MNVRFILEEKRLVHAHVRAPSQLSSPPHHSCSSVDGTNKENCELQETSSCTSKTCSGSGSVHTLRAHAPCTLSKTEARLPALFLKKWRKKKTANSKLILGKARHETLKA